MAWRRTRRAKGPGDVAERVAGYRDLRRVGHGGFSVVYRAWHEGLGRVVAVKVLSVDFVDDEVHRRLLREVGLSGRLAGHPNVVSVLDTGTTLAGRPYIAMEYYERGSLKDRLAAEGALPVSEVLAVGMKIAGALGAAHEEGILHRDVKPQNILLSRFGEPALGDFGTARMAATLGGSSLADALTPMHAAPEVLQGGAPSPRSDIYSLGSTLYHLLAGTAAYWREADTGVGPLLLRVLHDPVPPLTRADVPEELAAAIYRAMSREPDQRQASCAELIAELAQVQRGLAPAPGRDEPTTAGITAAGTAAAPENVPETTPEATGPVFAAAAWDYSDITGYRPASEAPPPEAEIEPAAEPPAETAPTLEALPAAETTLCAEAAPGVARTHDAPATVSEPELEPAARTPRPPRPFQRESTGDRAATAGRPRLRRVISVGIAPLLLLLVLTVGLIIAFRPGGQKTTAHGTAIVASAGTAVTLAQTTHASRSLAATPTTTARAGDASAATPGAGSRYDQTIGIGCARPDQTFTDQPIGDHPWVSASAASRPIAGCSNSFLYSSPTMDANQYKWENDYGWIFKGVPVDVPCVYHIYIPDSAYAQYDALYFWSDDGTYTDDHAFTVDQSRDRGQWVQHGPQSFPAGQAELEITDTRTGSAAGTLAASVVRLTCG
jgi:hypothetical protein